MTPIIISTIAVRNNTDVTVVLGLHEERARKYIAECYMSQLKLDVAEQMLQKYCWKEEKVSQALVIVNRLGGMFSQKVFAIQAPDPGPFVIGCREYWQGKDTDTIQNDIISADSDDDSDGSLDRWSDDEDGWDEDEIGTEKSIQRVNKNNLLG
jgi:hypothetical protein